jgi:hypothetical protein
VAIANAIVKRKLTALAPGGLWLSLIGSTEGPPREVGPPRRPAREIALAIEPLLEIVELRFAAFRDDAKAWFCLSRQRTMPAQPVHAARLKWPDRVRTVCSRFRGGTLSISAAMLA